MKKALLAVAALAAVVGAPALAWAGAPSAPIAAVQDERGGRLVVSTPAGDASRQATDYAAREAAAPQLGAFQGGDVGIYIGGSALGVVLVVVLIVLIL
jgi:hypothetical protein